MLERRTYAHGIAALVSVDLEREGFLVAFSERTGGVSPPPYDSLNLGFTRDDPALVRVNRRRTCTALRIRSFSRGWQVHGAGVALVGSALGGAGFLDPESAIPGTDALVTERPGIALSILTADCVPVAIADASSARVAVIHAGWRGIVAGIIPAALGYFDAAARPRAVIGPAIGPDHYEVGEDVARTVSRAAAGSALIHRRGGRAFIDLPATVAQMLEALGVLVIDRAEECTACEPS